MATLYLSLGTNLGNRRSNIKTALEHIGQRIGTVEAVSEIMETEPWGFDSTNSFLNIAAEVQTGLKPEDVLQKAQQIEKDGTCLKDWKRRLSGQSH